MALHSGAARPSPLIHLHAHLCRGATGTPGPRPAELVTGERRAGARASFITQLLENSPAMQETPVWFLGQEDPLEKWKATPPVFMGFPGSSAGGESAWNAGDLGSIPGLGRFPGEGKGYPLQYSSLENSMDCMYSWWVLKGHHWATFTCGGKRVCLEGNPEQGTAPALFLLFSFLLLFFLPPL